MGQPLSLHPLDIGILIIFAGLQTYVGLRIARRRDTLRSEANFLLDGRRLTLPAFVASLVCTWYGGILGVGEYTYKYGISNWLVFGVPYYLWAGFFAAKLAAKARRSPFVSISDHLYAGYGRLAGIVGTSLVFIMTVPAAYVLMMGVVLKLFFGWPLWVGVICGALVSIGYVYIGGFRSVVRTDILQFILMFGGFALILPFCLIKYGGWDFLTGALPASHFTWHGGNTAQYILVWYAIATATLIEPAFYQRCYAAKNEATARRGIWASIAFWCFFDFLTTSTGLYARAIIPNLTDPVTAFPALAAHVLPPVVVGLFFVGLLSTIISTVDSYSFLAAIALGRDIIWRNLRRKSEATVLFWTRVGLWVSAALAVGLALFSESVVDLWHDLGTIGAPALVIPMLVTFSDKWKLRPSWATISMFAAGTTSLVWLILGKTLPTGYPLGLEPIIPGLLISIGIYFLRRQRADSTRDTPIP
ncbi:sodium:solute symporter [Candidatus Zixiibacteriota bacterium]